MDQPRSTTEQPQIDITVLITCYNEEPYILDTIENVVGALQDAGGSYEVIVVDDVSKDHSVQRVREYIARHPGIPVRLHINPKNRGLANNYIDAAFLGSGKYYRMCCGDNAEPRSVLANIFRHVGKAEMVIPYQLQEEVAGKSFFRRILSRTFTFLVNGLSGYRLKYYNGLAVHLRYNVMRWHPTSYGFGFQADLVTRLLDEGVSYLQVPSSSVDRKGGTSTALSMRNVLSVTHTLLEIAIRRLKRFLYGGNQPRPVEVPLEEVSINQDRR
jgi:glycosyltransferase involved in cell wall biosynthesis